MSTRDLSNHNLSTKKYIFDRSHKKLTICQKFVQNVITRGKWRRPLGWGSLSACSARKPFFIHLLQYCGHCTSLKNDILPNCTCPKFLTDCDSSHRAIFKICAICRKFDLTHFLTQTFLAYRTDPVCGQVYEFTNTTILKNLKGSFIFLFFYLFYLFSFTLLHLHL